MGLPEPSAPVPVPDVVGTTGTTDAAVVVGDRVGEGLAVAFCAAATAASAAAVWDAAWAATAVAS